MPRTLKFALFFIVLILLPLKTVIAQAQDTLCLSQSLVYMSDISGDWEIYLQTADSPVNLTNDPAEDGNGDISPDGHWMVFHSIRDGNYEIYKIDLTDLSQPAEPLTDNDGADVHFYDPSWSPDGNQIVFKKDDGPHNGHGDIWIMDSDGNNEVNLTANHASTEEWVPRISKDGSQIYFVSRLNRDAGPSSDELFVMNIDGSNVEQLTDNDVPDWYPAINPITGEVAYISREASDADENIYRLEPDGGRTLLVGLPGDDGDPVWHCNGDLTFINSAATGSYLLYTMHPTQGNILAPEVGT